MVRGYSTVVRDEGHTRPGTESMAQCARWCRMMGKLVRHGGGRGYLSCGTGYGTLVPWWRYSAGVGWQPTPALYSMHPYAVPAFLSQRATACFVPCHRTPRVAIVFFLQSCSNASLLARKVTCAAKHAQASVLADVSFCVTKACGPDHTCSRVRVTVRVRPARPKAALSRRRQ